MNKHLKIEVNGQEWVNGEFSEISFTDGPAGIRVEAKTGRQPTSTSGGGLLEMLAGASRARTQATVQEKKAELADADVVEAKPVEIS